MCAITAEMPDTMGRHPLSGPQLPPSSGTGAAYLVQLLKHLPISIEVCNANLARRCLRLTAPACTSRTWSPCSTPQANTDPHKVSSKFSHFWRIPHRRIPSGIRRFFEGLVPEKKVHLGSPWNAALTFKKKSGRLPPRKKVALTPNFRQIQVTSEEPRKKDERYDQYCRATFQISRSMARLPDHFFQDSSLARRWQEDSNS